VREIKEIALGIIELRKSHEIKVVHYRRLLIAISAIVNAIQKLGGVMAQIDIAVTSPILIKRWGTELSK
jgi:hypothetical protein